MDKFNQLESLDKLAYTFANTDKMMMSSLKFEERSYVTTLASLYMMYDLVGTHIKDKVVKIKQDALKDYRTIHSELYFERLSYQQWQQSIKATERQTRELTEVLKSGDLQKSLELALEVIDTLLKENTLANMYRAVMQSAVTDDEIDSAVKNYAVEHNLELDSKDVEKIIYKFIQSLGTQEDLLCFKSMTKEEIEEFSKRLPDRKVEGIKTEVSEEYLKALSAS
jgi:hypothetical protein|nr:MAG TPA: hypothetical protein [Caudoviricetes sp.]